MLEDVTELLMKDHGYYKTPQSSRLIRAKPAKELTGSLVTTIEKLRDPRHDNSMGFVSSPLLYSKFFREKPAQFSSDIFRLIKGGWLIIIKVHSKPEKGTNAYRDSPYSNQFYNVELNPERF